MSGSPLRWPTKQVCIKCPFIQDLSSSPTGLYIYMYAHTHTHTHIYIYIENRKKLHFHPDKPVS